MTRSLSLLALALFAATSALAHVGLAQREAEAGSTYKAVLQISHGCAGSPTHTVTVRLPAGFQGVKPMPKPGWALAIQRQPLAQPTTSHGRTVTDEVSEVRWTALDRSAWLADAHFDEFVLRGQLPATAGPLWFQVAQTCETGAIDWADLPARGTDTRGMPTPAVLLQVRPAAPAHAHH